MPHSNHLRLYCVVDTRKGGVSSNYARLRHGWYKNVEHPLVSVRHGEQVYRVRIDSKTKSTITWPTVRLSKLYSRGTCLLPWLAPPCIGAATGYGVLGRNDQHRGRNVPELGTERPRLGRTWGGSTRGGSTSTLPSPHPQILSRSLKIHNSTENAG